MKRTIATLSAAAALASCGANHGAQPDRVTGTVTVKVPVPVSCIATPPPKPPQPFTDEAFKAADGPTRFAMLWTYRVQTLPWTQMAEAVMASCEKAAPAPAQ